MWSDTDTLQCINWGAAAATSKHHFQLNFPLFLALALFLHSSEHKVQQVLLWNCIQSSRINTVMIKLNENDKYLRNEYYRSVWKWSEFANGISCDVCEKTWGCCQGYLQHWSPADCVWNPDSAGSSPPHHQHPHALHPSSSAETPSSLVLLETCVYTRKKIW